MIGYLDKVTRPLVLVLPKMSGYVKTFKVKHRDKCDYIDDVECESFTVSSVDSLLFYKTKNGLQLCLGNCTYKIVGKQMVDYLDENIFETDKD